MAVSTGQRRPTAHTLAVGQNGDDVWTAVTGMYDSPLDDSTAGSLATGGITTVNQDFQYVRMENFNVLSEDGGPIPVGAVITRVLFEYRLKTTNGNGGLGLEHRARIRAEVRRNGSIVAGSSQTLNPGSGANTVVGPSTLSADYPGTASAPQTTFNRSDFANSADLQIQVTAQRTAGSAANDAVVACFWVAVTLEWMMPMSATMRGVSTITWKVKKAMPTARAAGVASVSPRASFKRQLSSRLASVALLSDSLIARRSISARAAGIPFVTKRVGKPLSGRMAGVGSFSRRITAFRTLSARAAGVSFFERRLAAKRAVSARMAGVGLLARALVVRRQVVATLRGATAAFIKVPFSKVSGGGATVVKKIIAIFDD